MSEQETLKGKIKRIFIGTEDEMEEFARELCLGNNYEYPAFFYKNAIECLKDEGYRDYIITGTEIYEVIETEDFSYDDIFEASKNPDGTISFVLSYYNGGCSFSEAIQEALENMKEDVNND